MRFSLVTHPFALVRSPLLPISTLLNHLPRIEAATDEVLWNWLNQPTVAQALLVASPSLYDVWLRWRQQRAILPSEEARLAMWRYLLRMSGRSTPFGMFAGVSVAATGPQTTGAIDSDVHRLCIRPDAAWLSVLTEKLLTQPQTRPILRYKVNNSLYRLGSQLRYSDYTLQAGQRAFYINSVAGDDLIDAVLHFVDVSSGGARGQTIVGFLVDTLHEEPEAAQELVNELIDAHILVSELELPVTDPDALGLVLHHVANVPALNALTAELTQIQEQLRMGCLATLGAHQTEQRMRALVGDGYTEKSVYQVDLLRPTEIVELSRSVLRQIGQELLQLSPLRSDNQPPALLAFAQRLHDRYGNQAVPLLTVLDHETGIGYGDSGPRAGQLTLLSELSQQQITRPSKADRLDGFRLEKLTHFLETGRLIQPITDEDLNNAAQTEPDKPLARSWAVLGELYGTDGTAIDAGNYQFLVKSVSGPSGASLMARFGTHNPPLTHQLEQLTAWEAQQHPDALLAEIVHLPAGRVGNVLCRPALRQYEIPYVTQSALDEEHTIALKDLWVRTGNATTVELWSKQHNRRVIPRNTTAHNYHQSDDIYRFLTDLSHQDEGFSLRWSWGTLANQPRLPRIIYKHLIVARAEWNLMRRANWLSAATMADDMQQKLSVPQLITLVEGDHELLLDLSSPPCQQILFTELSRRDSVRVVEWLGSPDQCWVHRAGQQYSSELVIPFGIAQTPSLPQHSPFKTSGSFIQRSFGPGSEWLYVKVYVGELTANDVLTQIVGPLVQQATAQAWIDHWFFIRYYDPEPHLRLRFHGSAETYHLLLTELTRQLAPWQEAGLVHSVSVDTYQRELERYGYQSMPLVERIFWWDSTWNLQWIEQSAFINEDVYWWVACQRADRLLDAFGLSVRDKQALTEELQARFLRENKHNERLRKELNAQYRAWQERLSTFEQTELESVDMLLPDESIQQLRVQYQADAFDLSDLLRALLHMMFNRFFVSNQRISEGVIYHFLLRQYTTLQGKERTNKAKMC